MSIECKEFGYWQGYRCHLVTLKNKNGLSAAFTDFGAAVQSLCVPDKGGKLADVVLGYDTLDEYVKGDYCHGATIGRYANRIGGAKFTLNGKEYKLAENDNGNSLHGGGFGYNKRLWTIEELSDGDEPAVTFGLTSPDGEEHFPGTVKLKVTFTLLENGLHIRYNAVSDKDTILNLTNHSYFNLKGEGEGDIKDHIVKINAAKYTPVDGELIPTGVMAYVTGTAFDFQSPKPVRTDMDNGRLPDGYDHNFVLGEGKQMRTAAVVTEPVSGRVMTVRTDKPAIQLYIGIGLKGETGKGGHKYDKYAGLCLESQYCPDSPNKPQFGSCVLKAGEEYCFTTSYTFSIADD